jgi:hypothetical protein
MRMGEMDDMKKNSRCPEIILSIRKDLIGNPDSNHLRRWRAVWRGERVS